MDIGAFYIESSTSLKGVDVFVKNKGALDKVLDTFKNKTSIKEYRKAYLKHNVKSEGDYVHGFFSFRNNEMYNFPNERSNQFEYLFESDLIVMVLPNLTTKYILNIHVKEGNSNISLLFTRKQLNNFFAEFGINEYLDYSKVPKQEMKEYINKYQIAKKDIVSLNFITVKNRK